MINISIPNLSRSRGTSHSNHVGQKHEYRYGKRKITVHKTVQYWFDDMKYDGKLEYFADIPDNTDPTFDELQFRCQLGKDCRKNAKVIDRVMHGISKRIHRSTRMTPIPRWSSTQYQV